MTGGEYEPIEASIQIVITISGHPRLIQVKGSRFRQELPFLAAENAGIIRVATAKIKSSVARYSWYRRADHLWLSHFVGLERQGDLILKPVKHRLVKMPRAASVVYGNQK